MNPAYTWDIETEDWTTFVLGAIHDGDTTVVYDHRHEEEYLRYLIAREGELYAHNGGRFDDLWLLDAMRRFKIKMPTRIAANTIGIVKMEIGKAKFLDSYRIFPMSLRALTDGAKDDLANLCTCGKDCGGYCAIRRDAPPEVMKRVKKYLIQDVESLWQALKHFQTRADQLGIELGMTIGSSAWRTVKKELSLEDAPYKVGKEWQTSRWKRVRAAYYGGRCEVFRPESESGWQYDVNSMYPAKLAKTPLPVGQYTIRYGSAAARAYGNEQPGVFAARVDVPDMWIPPLPVRLKGGRMAFPTGIFSGVWTGLELSYAESLGVNILRFQSSYTFERTEIIFDGWIERLFRARMKFGKSSREGKWLKLVMNSLTGKFGSKCENCNIIIDPDEVKVCKCEGMREAGDCSCGGYRPIGGSTWMFLSVVERMQSCAHAEWSAYLTSAARVELHRGLTERAYDAVYCDTDGIFSEGPRTRNIGDGLGEWQSKGEYLGFQALAPKVYRYYDTDGEHVRAKGIPQPDWKKILAGEPSEFGSMAGLRRPQNGRFFVRVKSHRKVNRNYGSRELDGKVTRPLTYKECVDRFG